MRGPRNVREATIRTLVQEMAAACAAHEPEPQMDDLLSAGFTFAHQMMAIVLKRHNCPENRALFRATLERMLLDLADTEVRH